MYGCNIGQITVRIEQLFTKAFKEYQYNTRQIITDGFFIQEFVRYQAEIQYNSDAINCGTVFPQKYKKNTFFVII